MSNLSAWRRAIIESDFPAVTRHIMLTLSVHSNEDGYVINMSIPRLARETALDPAIVDDHLEIARRLGVVDGGFNLFVTR